MSTLGQQIRFFANIFFCLFTWNICWANTIPCFPLSLSSFPVMQLQVSEGTGRLAFPSCKKTSWGQEPLIALPVSCVCCNQTEYFGVCQCYLSHSPGTKICPLKRAKKWWRVELWIGIFLHNPIIFIFNAKLDTAICPCFWNCLWPCLLHPSLQPVTEAKQNLLF